MTDAWAMSTTEVALTAHLVRPRGGDEDALISAACRQLRARYGIAHATLQFERGSASHPCELALLGTV
jgi:cobalt-zinc-cadmium efflux system protein